MVSADNIDNKLRRKMLDIMYPKANITTKGNIFYGNISDKIISAKVEYWVKALGLKESVDLDEKPFLKKIKMDKFSRSERKRKKKIHKSNVRYNKMMGIESVELGEGRSFFKHPLGSPEYKRQVKKVLAKSKKSGGLVTTLALAKAQLKKSGGRQLKNPKTEVLVVDKKGKVIVIDKKDQKKYLAKGWGLAESVEVDEKKHSYTYEFPDNRKAKQFAKDISNSAVATGTVSGNRVIDVEVLKGSPSLAKSAIAKYLKQNRGKEISESIAEEISPAQAKKMGINMPLSGKGYPYNESYLNNSSGETMRTYKDFKNTLIEQGEYTPSGMKHTGRDARDSNVPLHDLGNPEALGAVNAFIEQYTSQEYMNPRQAVVQLRARLNTVGLHFDFHPNGTVEEGKEEYPLTLFGGRSGWDMEKGGISEDDGITPKLGYGLSMQIEYTVAESGLYRIGAKIVKQTKAKAKGE
jgi:hypothetical protein